MGSISHDQIVGKYDLVSYDNYDKYLKELGVQMVEKKILREGKSIFEITENNGKWAFKTLFPTKRKNTEINFTLDMDFDEITADGRQYRSIITREGDTLIQIQKCKEYQTKIIREFDDFSMTATFRVNDLTASCFYGKVED